ncbi:hypothetical protein HM1_0485 [Heliomicrobium modesticaldum Ice1]|uniref:Uncharacterized protein n=1 Tax=Heliobacterium modesticaldum (strain ATCC 51547 / Ice1) TaxID=498761 RepID=B0TFK0_HELMI|nr:hypothetical protein HM1_0485 [Heliomicrobium modesticaldum Ice1]
MLGHPGQRLFIPFARVLGDHLFLFIDPLVGRMPTILLGVYQGNIHP